MERMTRVLDTGSIWPIHGVDEALKQLAAYENTGFTPEQIEKLKKELYLTGTYVSERKENNHKPAQWLINSDGYYPYCSNCKAKAKDGLMTEYCLRCKAKMEGVQCDN